VRWDVSAGAAVHRRMIFGAYYSGAFKVREGWLKALGVTSTTPSSSDA
jgi:hypothetical protein